MNLMQEEEFHLSIYHYFVWKERQARAAATETTLVDGPSTVEPDAAGGDPQQPPAPNTEEGDQKPAAKEQGSAPAPGGESPGATLAAETEDGNGSSVAAQNQLASKYRAMADAMLHHFPQHLAQFKDNSQALQNTVPPVLSTLYIDYPALQAHSISARTRIAHLESMLPRTTTLEMNDAQQQRRAAAAASSPALAEEAPAAPPGPNKRGRESGTDVVDGDELEAASGKRIRFRDRDDIPRDIQELITELRTGARQQKAAGRKRIDRLEARLRKEREGRKEAAKKAARIAVETLQRLQPDLVGGGGGGEEKTEAAQAAAAAAAAAAATAGDDAAAATSTPTPTGGGGGKPKPPPPEPPRWKATATFEERLEELEHFRRGNGHCRVPLRERGLGRWVGEVRTLYRKVREDGEASPTLTAERIARLDAMGFTWRAKDKTVPWQQRFEELKVFKEQFGHCSVPRTSYKDNPALGEWVHMQRKLYRQKEPVIMGAREQKLNEVGFVWETGRVRPSFEERLEECRAFRRDHGHLDIPLPAARYNKGDPSSSNHQSKEARSFRTWAQRQREEHRRFNANLKSSLDRVKIKKLTDMGFAWELKTRGDGGRPRAYRPGKPKNEDRFKERIGQLLEVKDRYGRFNDLKTLTLAGYGETSSLYQWVKAQRKQYKARKAGQWSSLTEERLEMLDNIGFNFEPRKHYAAYGSGSKSSRRKSKDGVDNDDGGMRKVLPEATDQLDGEASSVEGNSDDNHNHQIPDPC